MSDIVYSIKDIFSTNKQEGALGQRDAEKYYIAPYQRGYKWGSDNPNAAVWLLMTDIKDAYEGNEEEYYLQYITVKQNELNGKKVLEVIDGQLRLTTLTLIFSVLAWKLKDESIAISNFKTSYKIRKNVSRFFTDFVYNGIEHLMDKSWDTFKNENPEYDAQDIYYMFHAIHCINKQLPDNIREFYNYIANNVKIIFNLIDEGNLSSEKVFSNLNTNKVDLTGTELVKGLLLTRAGREIHNEETVRHFKEVLELRSTMGRQWDEMANWTERNEIKSFYFSDFTEPMAGLIFLLGLKYNYNSLDKNENSKYDIFNFYQTLIKREGKQAHLLFFEMRQLYFLLRDWYSQTEPHNLFGYLFSYKDSNFTLASLIPMLEKDKPALREELTKQILELIDIRTGDLIYGETNWDIHKLLLFINVFGSDIPFNFKDFKENKWTLEHIFPQNPDFLPNTIGTRDIELIRKLLPGNWRQKIKDRLLEIVDESMAEKQANELEWKLSQETCELSKDQKVQLYQIMNKQRLNSIGNMALLAGKDNISNSNGLFDAKRQNIIRLISKGSFVPRHTYEVFSKLLSDKMDSDLSVWSESDINAHEDWINMKVKSIIKILKNEQSTI